MNDTTKPQRKLPDAGLQPARCFAIVDVGMQKVSFKGVEKDPQSEIMIFFELPKFMHSWKEGEPKQPLIVIQRYTWSAGQKAKLPKVLKSWGKLSKNLESITVKLISQYVGAPCLLDIEHNERDGVTYANISAGGLGVRAITEEFKAPEPFYTKMFFNLAEFTWEKFNNLPVPAQKKIRESLNWSKILEKHPEPVNNQSSSQNSEDADDIITNSDDDIPKF